MGFATSTITVKYYPKRIKMNLFDGIGQTHKYVKTNDWKKDEWFSITKVIGIEKENNRILLQLNGIKNRWIYYLEHDGADFLEHLKEHELKIPEEYHYTSKRGTFKRRRLVEAAYYSFIGLNMLLMCCLLVGISFAYHVGTHETNYEPIRW